MAEQVRKQAHALEPLRARVWDERLVDELLEVAARLKTTIHHAAMNATARLPLGGALELDDCFFKRRGDDCAAMVHQMPSGLQRVRHLWQDGLVVTVPFHPFRELLKLNGKHLVRAG